MITEIKEEHLEVCAKLYVDVLNDEPWNDQWTSDTALTRLKDIYRTPHFKGIVYITSGEIKGAILGNIEQFYNGKHYNLKEMFIAKSVQRKQIGSQMLQYLEESMKQDVNMMILFTSKANGTDTFYIKNDYQELNKIAFMVKKI